MKFFPFRRKKKIIPQGSPEPRQPEPKHQEEMAQYREQVRQEKIELVRSILPQGQRAKFERLLAEKERQRRNNAKT
jgi:radical SAM superfamily enzyme with C-terminal helix-hairpin-helix motif